MTAFFSGTTAFLTEGSTGSQPLYTESESAGGNGTEGSTQTQNPQQQNDGQQQASYDGGSFQMIIILTVVIIGTFVFSSFSQRKRDKKAREMMESIKTGDTVMLNNGMYGKVIDIRDEVFIVEFGTNKGVSIPVRKTDVYLMGELNLTAKKSE